MKTLYKYSLDTGLFEGIESVADNTTSIPRGLTEIPVPKDLINPKFDEKQQKWIGEKLNDWMRKQQSNHQQLLRNHPELIPDDQKQRQLLMDQSQQLAVLRPLIMKQNQDNAKLQATNQKQATQIKQLQQMVMLANQQQAVEKSKEANE